MNAQETQLVNEFIKNNQLNSSSKMHDVPAWLTNFIDVYQSLNLDNLSLLERIYAQHISFSDPIHTVSGFTNLLGYFQHLYTNINYCHFTIFDYVIMENRAAIFWQMDFSHPKLNSGKNISVSGTSKLISDGNKVISHRDYFDVGSMLYEHISVLGSLVRFVKRRAADFESPRNIESESKIEGTGKGESRFANASESQTASMLEQHQTQQNQEYNTK